jgi:hypothetical protein
MYKNNILQRQIRVFNTINELEIRIPLKKNTTALIGLIVATIAWIFTLYVLIHFILPIKYIWYKLALLLAIISWFALGMAGASMFIWLFFGRERIIVTKDYFITDKPLVFFYRRNFYNIKEISNLHVDVELYKINRNNTWKDEQRTVIKFDTQLKQVIFARGIEKEIAQNIIIELAKSSFLNKSQFSVEQKL